MACEPLGREYSAAGIWGTVMWRWIGWIVLVLTAASPVFAQKPAKQAWQKKISVYLTRSDLQSSEAPDLQGAVKVGFVINRAGKLVSSWLEENSGNADLDQAALAFLERAQPFPAPPDKLADDSLRMTVEFVFVARPAWSWEQNDAAAKSKLRGICRGC